VKEARRYEEELRVLRDEAQRKREQQEIGV
jgi:hypothetical protein